MISIIKSKKYNLNMRPPHSSTCFLLFKIFTKTKLVLKLKKNLKFKIKKKIKVIEAQMLLINL